MMRKMQPGRAAEYEQRHFSMIADRWSDWYPSDEEAYREQCARPISTYEVRPKSQKLEQQKGRS